MLVCTGVNALPIDHAMIRNHVEEGEVQRICRVIADLASHAYKGCDLALAVAAVRDEAVAWLHVRRLLRVGLVAAVEAAG